MAITFDSIELKAPSPFIKVPVIQLGDTVLLSGKHSLQPSTETALNVAFSCFTDTYSDISNLFAKVGAIYSLVINSEAARTCSISSWSEIEDPPGWWTYVIGFKEETV